MGLSIRRLGSVQHYLGLLATTCRDWDTALRHLEQAIAVNRGLGATLPLAHALCEYACTLRNADRDPERMRASFDEAANLVRERGCVVVAKKVDAALADVRDESAESGRSGALHGQGDC